MTPKRKTMAWLGGGVALMVVGTAVMFLLARHWKFAPPPKLVLSKETTFLTGPIALDGGIDWVAAIEAEARAEGFKDDDNAAPLMREAVDGLVDVWTWVEESGTKIEGVVDPDLGNIDSQLEIERALGALGRGELDAPNVAAVMAWIEACAPALEKARQAAEREAWLLMRTTPPLDLIPTFSQLGAIDELMRALCLRIAVRAARGDVEGALADAATACATARRTGSPAATFELAGALAREVEVLQQVVRCVRGAAKLPADRALAVVEARPARWRGEAALREAMRAERLVATSELDHVRRFDATQLTSRDDPESKALLALQRTDPNLSFRHLQGRFDDLGEALLDSSRPLPDRLDALEAEIDRRVVAASLSKNKIVRSVRLAFVSDESLARWFVDRMLREEMYLMKRGVAELVAHTARRDALLAELAARAGAPERRDSWLGEPLIVTRNKDDGSIDIGGALIELARERGAEFDEE